MSDLKKMWGQHKRFVFFVSLMFVFRSAVADWNYIPSSSMNPTLLAGDRVVVSKLAYTLRLPFTLHQIVRWDSPHTGDVITFDSPKDELNLIKRVVGVAGDVVAMKDNQLSINGHPVERTLLDARRELPTEAGSLQAEVWAEHLGNETIEVARLPAANRFRDFDAVRVPRGMLLVLGDSRDNSNDSRFIGFIDVDRVTGQALRVALSHDPDHFYLPRSNRWWVPLHS